MKNKLLFSTKGAEVVSLLILSFSFFFTPLVRIVVPHAPPRPPPAARSLIFRGSSPSLHLDLPSSPSLRYRKQVRVCVACPSTASSRAWHKQGSLTLSPSLHDAASYVHTVCLPTLCRFFSSLFSVSTSVCPLSLSLTAYPYPLLDLLIFQTCWLLSFSRPALSHPYLPPYLFPVTRSLMLFSPYLPWPILLFCSIVLLLLVAFPIIGHSCGRGGRLSGRAGGKHPLTCLLECSSTTT